MTVSNDSINTTTNATTTTWDGYYKVTRQEVIEEFDKDGKLIRRTTRDIPDYVPSIPYWQPAPNITTDLPHWPFWQIWC